MSFISFLILTFILASGLTCTPPAGYTISPLNSFYYKGYNTLATYFEARTTCEEDGARMANFKSSTDFDALLDVIDQIGGGNIWVGILARTKTACVGVQECVNHFAWEDGSQAAELQGSFIDELEINDQAACSRLRSGGLARVGDMMCDTSNKYICQYDCNNVYDGSLGLTCPSASAPAPPYFTPWNGKYYRVFTTQMSYADAEATCRHFSSVVATFKTSETWFNAKFHAEITSGRTYVGLSDPTEAVNCLNEQCNDQVVWSDGTPFTYDPNVMTDDIQFETGRGCQFVDVDLTMKGEDCSNIHGFTCQLDCNSPISTTDGGWSDWSAPSGCVNGAAFEYRNRTCNNPTPSFFGTGCAGDDTEAIACPASWMEWSAWSSCSRTCGYGIQRRTRICSEMDQCSGQDIDYGYCTLSPCDGITPGIKFTKYPVDTSIMSLHIGNLGNTLGMLGFAAAYPETYCASACSNLRTNQNDVTSCNSFIIDGLNCHFGFASLDVIHNVTVTGIGHIYLDFE